MQLYIEFMELILIRRSYYGNLKGHNHCRNADNGGGALNDYIINQGVSNNIWFREWASGFKECGGIYWKGSQVKTTVTINFPISFSNKNYTFNHQWLYNSNSGSSPIYGEIYTNRTKTSTQIYDAAGWFGYEWRAEGY